MVRISAQGRNGFSYTERFFVERSVSLAEMSYPVRKTFNFNRKRNEVSRVALRIIMRRASPNAGFYEDVFGVTRKFVAII